MVGIFIIMKIIITESQHKKLQMRQWLLRRYDLVKSAFNETIDELFEGELAQQAKQRAAVIGWTINAKMNPSN